MRIERERSGTVEKRASEDEAKEERTDSSLQIVSGHPGEEVVSGLVLKSSEVEPEEGVDENLRGG